MTKKQKIILYIVGMLLIGIGTIFIDISSLGLDAWNAADFTLASIINISPGMAIFLVGILMVICVELIPPVSFSKKTLKNGVVTIVIGLVLGAIVDSAMEVLEHLWEPNYIQGFIGILAMGLGIAFLCSTGLLLDPVNHTINQLHKKAKVSLHTSTFIVDAAGYGLALILGVFYYGPNDVFNHYIGWGSLITFIALPFAVMLGEYIVEKFFGGEGLH